MACGDRSILRPLATLTRDSWGFRGCLTEDETHAFMQCTPSPRNKTTIFVQNTLRSHATVVIGDRDKIARQFVIICINRIAVGIMKCYMIGLGICPVRYLDFECHSTLHAQHRKVMLRGREVRVIIAHFSLQRLSSSQHTSRTETKLTLIIITL
jgi:hypothetical protein